MKVLSASLDASSSRAGRTERVSPGRARAYAGLFADKLKADGYYHLVQAIAEKCGDTAFALAEEVFKEMGLEYDPKLLRTPDTIRRPDYTFTGANVYCVTIQPFAAHMTPALVRLYNHEMRTLGKDYLMSAEWFDREIVAAPGVHRLLVACNDAGTVQGFAHCALRQTDNRGSVEAMVFLAGRIYEPTRKSLVAGFLLREQRTRRGADRRRYPLSSYHAAGRRIAARTETPAHRGCDA